jgi:hypothetical protein
MTSLRVHDFAARHLGIAITELTFQITTTAGQQNSNERNNSIVYYYYYYYYYCLCARTGDRRGSYRVQEGMSEGKRKLERLRI